MADVVYPPIIAIVKTLWKYLGLQFTFYGEAHVPKKGSAILAMNHVGYLDFALAGTAVLPSGRLVRFMAKKEIFDNPIAGPLMRGMKHISVDRKNGGPSFIAALRALKAGEIVGVFPEATISQSFELKLNILRRQMSPSSDGACQRPPYQDCGLFEHASPPFLRPLPGT